MAASSSAADLLRQAGGMHYCQRPAQNSIQESIRAIVGALGSRRNMQGIFPAYTLKGTTCERCGHKEPQ